jgi:hypothetical protein
MSCLSFGTPFETKPFASFDCSERVQSGRLFVMVRINLCGLEANSTVEKKESRLAIAATHYAGIRACVTVNQGNYFLVVFAHGKLSGPY